MKYFRRSLLALSLFFNWQSAALAADNAVVALSRAYGTSLNAAEEQIDKVFDVIASELQEGREVIIRNFGRFYVRHRDPRKGRNPRTGVPLQIQAKNYARFSSSDTLKKKLNTPQALSAAAPVNVTTSSTVDVKALK
jgi:nucleoid DNA-binding protein